jgi:hypothetical protein
MAVGEIGRMENDARMVKEADTPERMAAVLGVIRDRDAHRRALAVARASAPIVNITNKFYG